MKSYLQLMRPANLLTAAADVLAGAALAFGATETSSASVLPVNLWLLVLSTVGLYGGGVVLNDVFDAKLDAVERPERPIPSGRVSVGQASVLGIALLILGIGAAYLFSPMSAWLALIIAGLAVFYNRFGKHHALFGPLNMGLCRGANLLLGISAAGTLPIKVLWPVALIPVIYIAAVTMISRGEVHGGNRTTLWGAAVLFLLVSSLQIGAAVELGTLWLAIGFVALHLLLVLRPLWTAIQQPIGPNIGAAVKAGVLSLIVMDAAWAALSGHWLLALFLLALLPLSLPVARYFAVT